ncbi:MAG: peptidase domain-containing ABC transporter [Pseudanabaenaceae cyanobacterium]
MLENMEQTEQTDSTASQTSGNFILADKVRQFLADTPPFADLPKPELEKIWQEMKLVRLRMGQPVITKDALSPFVYLVWQGRLRLLAQYRQRDKNPFTLKLLDPRAVVGAISLIRQVPTELAIACEESICIAIPAQLFQELLTNNPDFQRAFWQTCSCAEVFDLVDQLLVDSPIKPPDNWQELCVEAERVGLVKQGNNPSTDTDQEYLWLFSGGDRFVGLPLSQYGFLRGSKVVPDQTGQVTATAEVLTVPELPYAEEIAPPAGKTYPMRTDAYPFIGAKDQKQSILACFQMVCKHLRIPFRQEPVKYGIEARTREQMDDKALLSVCAAIAEYVGLNCQSMQVPAKLIYRLPCVAILVWQGKLAVVFEATPSYVVLAVPEVGMKQLSIDEFAEIGSTVLLLSLQPTRETPQEKFGLSWFIPFIIKYRRVLTEVFLASFFVQLFAIASPLLIQVLIDKVLVQNAPDTLNIIGITLITVALFEALLSSLRTYLFADTTNRIDIALGAEIIDRLFRLPLRFFEKYPVGELSTRVNELENIRQFMTGTALTVVLDSIFSVFYIIIMFFYDWRLTLVALSTIPIFVVLTLIATPILRSQVRAKAQKYAQAQAQLVEILTGIQTVKSQNIELRSRWRWQERYGKYMVASFRTIVTATTAQSASHFFSQMSGLLVLWAGASLMLHGKGTFTLGMLIAFRIIASYATTPILRLVQLWQNFQETAISLERLADIIDTPTEIEASRGQIALPRIKGNVVFENVCFRFASSGPLQLKDICLDIPAGTFVGIAGLSGSGKSTLVKLLPRLYDPLSGRVFIDNYDISKVDLYSLRSQIGLVPQEPLLFDGTIQENIALGVTDASDAEIVAAAKLAVAHEFIMSLPNGYNYRVGERGANLSGGQKQRIAIARTILQQPKLLILDEATSALDYNTERQVCRNLIETFRDRTIFFITHRLGTIQSADLILYMHEGEIVERGTHSQLLAARGRYYSLYMQQSTQIV